MGGQVLIEHAHIQRNSITLMQWGVICMPVASVLLSVTAVRILTETFFSCIFHLILTNFTLYI